MPPAKLKTLIFIVLSIVVMFILMESSHKGCIDGISQETKSMMNRVGIFLGYLSAIIGGSFVFWDSLAHNGKIQAEADINSSSRILKLLNDIRSETGNNYDTAVSQQTKIIDSREQEIDEYDKYHKQKTKIQIISISLLILSLIFILVAATDSSRKIDGKSYTCNGKTEMESK